MLRFMLVRGSNRPADASSADDKGASSLPSAVWRMRAVRAAATISRGGGVRLVGIPPVGTGAVGERGCSSRSAVRLLFVLRYRKIAGHVVGYDHVREGKFVVLRQIGWVS